MTAPPSAPQHTVLLLAPSRHPACRALRELLRRTEGFRVVAEAGSVEGAAAEARPVAPDLVVLALDVEDGPLVDAVELIQTQSAGSRIVVFGETLDGLRQQELARKGALVRALWRDLDEERLDAMLTSALLGIRAESPEIQASAARGGLAGVRFSELERAVLRLLRDGLLQRGIAERLNVGQRTVESALERARAKTDSRTTGELVHKIRDVDLKS